MKIEWLQVLIAFALGVAFAATVKAAIASAKSRVGG